MKKLKTALALALMLMSMAPTVAADFDPKGSRSDPAQFPKYGEWALDAATADTSDDDADTDHHATPGVMVPAEEDQRAYWSSSFELVLSKEGTLKILFFGCPVATEEQVQYILIFEEYVLVFSNQNLIEIREPSPGIYLISKIPVEPEDSTEGGEAA